MTLGNCFCSNHLCRHRILRTMASKTKNALRKFACMTMAMSYFLIWMLPMILKGLQKIPWPINVNSVVTSMKYFLSFFFLLAFAGCKEKKAERVIEEETESHSDLSAYGFDKLSAYSFFKTPIKNLEPVEGIIPYQLNSPLFSDYAFKKRFLKIPEGQKATYNSDEVFDFPVGTVLIKNFYYPADFRKPESDLRILETRLLIKDEKE